MVISIGLDTNITSICNIYLVHNPIIATQTSLTALKSLILSLGVNTISTTATFLTSKSSKWVYTRCAYSFDFGSMYTFVSHGKIEAPVVDTKDITFETGWKDSPLDVHFKKFKWNNATDALKLSILGTSTFTPGKSTFLKNIYLFKDMLPVDLKIQY